MKRQLKYITTVSVFLILVISSCSDSFLNEKVEDQYSTEITDSESLRASLILLYEATYTFYGRPGPQGWVSVWNVGTDITWPTEPQGVEIPFYRYNTLTTDNAAASFMWNWEYNIIENANNAINNIETNGENIAGLTEEKRIEYLAEAKFFRGKAYDELATLFGGVPIVKDPITEPKFDFTRASLDDVNALIEEDLTYAVANLPGIGQTEHEQRVSSAAASQLLAKAYLRMGEYENAEDQADLVINNPDITLVDSRYGVKADEPGDPFSDMFWKGNTRRSQGNTEAVWVLEVENQADFRVGNKCCPQQRRNWGAGYHNRNGMIPSEDKGGRGLSRMRLNNWVLYDLYDDGDMRNSEHNIKRQHIYNDPTHELFGQPVPYEGPDTLRILNPYTMKWKHFDPRDTFGFAMWKDIIMMRLGETYLLRAEARFMKTSSDPSGAADDINVLRQRANAPLVSAGDIDLDFILDERVRELVGEENRRMELMRTKTLVDRVHLNDDAPEGMQIEGIEDTHLLFPIPSSERQLNSGADLEQNPGYTQ